MQSIEKVLSVFDLTLLDGQMILVCAVLFVFFIAMAKRTLYGPFIALYEAREAATEGAETEAQAIHKKVATLTQDYERQLVDARVAAMAQKLEAIAKAKEHATKLTDEAEQAAQAGLTVARHSLESLRAKLRSDGASDADAMAQEIVQKILTPSDRVVRSVQVQ